MKLMFRIVYILILLMVSLPLQAQEIEDSLLPPLVKKDGEYSVTLPEYSLEEEQASESEQNQSDFISDEQIAVVEKVKLRGLNKITARQSILEQRIGRTIYFGNLEILIEKCWVAPPEDSPESKVLLDIWEQKPNEDKKHIFYGWMFASSPGLVSLEHPVYDINVLGCY